MNEKIRELAIYGVCGAMAATLNLGVFALLADVAEIHYLLATALAWICSTCFAFVSNKFFVFKSMETGIKTFVREGVAFLGSRCISGVMDVAGMYLLVEMLHIGHDVAKIVVMVLIVLNNYILSKYVVFKRK